MSPDTFLKKGDRLMLVTVDEAQEVCGASEEIGDTQVASIFNFPEFGSDSDGQPYTLSLQTIFLNKYGGTVMTICKTERSFGGPHIHYSAKPDEWIDDDDRMPCDDGDDVFFFSFCPAMFSGYAEEEYEIDPLEQDYVEGLFGSLFFA